MKRRFRRPPSIDSIDDVGQDSFLDTIANLVGVLIILVVVVGAESRNVVAANREHSATSEKLATARAAADRQQTLENSVHSDYENLQYLIRREEKMMELRAHERQSILVRLALADEALNRRREQLAEKEQHAVTAAAGLHTLYRQLGDLQQQIAATKSAGGKTETIEHYPTPIAKTVFRDEVHFRLGEGKISFVPMDDLIGLMPQKSGKSKQRS